MPLTGRQGAQSFDGFAARYDRFCGLIDEPLWPKLESYGITGGRRALDAGCGSGRRAVELAEHYGEVVAVDISEPLIALALALAGDRRPDDRVQYRVGDLATLEPGGMVRFEGGFATLIWHNA